MENLLSITWQLMGSQECCTVLGGIRSNSIVTKPKSFKTLPPPPRQIMTGASLYTAGKRANVLLLRLESFETAVCNSN